jgi:signal peptidase I
MRNERGPVGLLSALQRYLFLLGALRVAVAGRSMEPVLLDGDHLLVARILPRLRGIRRGDVVFLRAGHAGSTNPECIKRIVGLPHDHVQVAGDEIVVNGSPLAVASTAPRIRPFDGGDRPLASRVWTLGADHYFVLGDNLAHSTDSRSVGPVTRRDIIGIACYRYAPPARRGWLLHCP